MNDAASASGVSTMTNDDDEAVQLLGQPGWEQEVDSDFEREFAQLVGAPLTGMCSHTLRSFPLDKFSSHAPCIEHIQHQAATPGFPRMQVDYCKRSVGSSRSEAVSTKPTKSSTL